MVDKSFTLAIIYDDSILLSRSKNRYKQILNTWKKRNAYDVVINGYPGHLTQSSVLNVNEEIGIRKNNGA